MNSSQSIWRSSTTSLCQTRNISGPRVRSARWRTLSRFPFQHGETSSRSSEIRKDISLKTVEKLEGSAYDFQEEFRRHFPHAPVLSIIYAQSKISQNDYYETSSRISYYMSISQNELDNLEFYVWSNMGLYLADIIKAENEASNGGKGEGQESMEQMKSNYSKQMSSMKNNMKVPNMKTPKI